MTKQESDSESSALHKRQASLLTQEMSRNILNEIQRESHFDDFDFKATNHFEIFINPFALLSSRRIYRAEFEIFSTYSCEDSSHQMFLNCLNIQELRRQFQIWNWNQMNENEKAFACCHSSLVIAR